MAGIWINSSFTIDDALSFQQNVWELLIDEWGNVLDPSGYSTSFPKVGERGLPTVYGVAIGPRSLVDRCFVNYALQKTIPDNVTFDSARRVSLGSPAMFPQLGNRSVIPAAPNTFKSSLSVSSRLSNSNADLDGSTTYQAQYFLPTGVAANMQTDGDFVAPLLHLLFFLKPPALYPPTKRFPIKRLIDTGLGAGNQVIAAPTHGRRRVHVTLQNGNVNPGENITFSVLGIRTMVAPYSAQVIAPGLVLPGAIVDYTIDTTEYDYIIVRGVPAVVGVGAVTGSFSAED